MGALTSSTTDGLLVHAGKLARMTAAFDFSLFDTSVRPADDLFRHVNGTWLREAQIDTDKAGIGAFIELRDLSEERVRDIVTGLEPDDLDSEAGKIAALHHSFMDTGRIEARAGSPLEPLLQRVEAISSTEAFARFLGWALRHGLTTLVGMSEDADPGDPGRYVMFVGQSGLGLPDEEYYREDEHAQTRTRYVEYLTRILELAGVGDAAAQAATVLALETRIASHHWDKVKVRDFVAMYNPMTWEQMMASAPGLDWSAFLEGADIPADKVADVVVAQPPFVTGAAELVASGELDAWKSWARVRVISRLASYLSSDFVEARFDFYERHLNGTEELRARWKRAVAFTEGAMGEAIGKIYVERHFPPAAKEAMDELVANLMQAYHDSISTLGWLTDQTRAEALDKLSKFTPKIAYPATWRDYSALQVSPDDLVGNLLAVNSFDTDWVLDKVGGPVDKDEWLMFPQTVNAYYHPLRNEIVFPAAILQPPFFNVDADDPVNYAAIGAVIGHEIGHGFDDKGSTCDGDGRLRDWWTPEDRSAFEALTSKLVTQYADLSPEGADGQKVNGEMTLGENIGDLGGLGIAYKAWLLSGGDPDGEPVDGLTPAQRFFFGWAAAWRSKHRPEAVRMRLTNDVHSPAEFRCNQVVRNLDAFHEAFGTSDGDALWLEPSERVAIW